MFVPCNRVFRIYWFAYVVKNIALISVYGAVIKLQSMTPLLGRVAHTDT